MKWPPAADFTGQAEDRVKKIEVEILLARFYFSRGLLHLKVPQMERGRIDTGAKEK